MLHNILLDLLRDFILNIFAKTEIFIISKSKYILLLYKIIKIVNLLDSENDTDSRERRL